MVVDVSELGVSGYDAADWLREQHRNDMGLSDHRRRLGIHAWRIFMRLLIELSRPEPDGPKILSSPRITSALQASYIVQRYEFPERESGPSAVPS